MNASQVFETFTSTVGQSQHRRQSYQDYSTCRRLQQYLSYKACYKAFAEILQAYLIRVGTYSVMGYSACSSKSGHRMRLLYRVQMHVHETASGMRYIHTLYSFRLSSGPRPFFLSTTIGVWQSATSPTASIYTVLLVISTLWRSLPSFLEVDFEGAANRRMIGSARQHNPSQGVDHRA